MADDYPLFAAKSIGLSRYGGRKPCSLEVAARHNLREIQAEHGASSHIDASRIKRNVMLAGPRTAKEVQAQADMLLAAANIDSSKLRRDHCQAIEVLFSLSPSATLEPVVFFRRCLDWIFVEMRLPVLSAVVHFDEAAPHTHVLLLPLRGGQYVGNKPVANAALRALRESFFVGIAGPAGLKRPGAKMTGMVKRMAVAAALKECEAQGIPEKLSNLWLILKAAIERDPTKAVHALQISDEKIRATQKDMAKPIGFQEVNAKAKTYLCVGFANPTTSPPPQKAVESLSELWECVGRKVFIGPNIGRRLMCIQRKRPAVARETRRKEMVKPDKQAAPGGTDESEMVRIRDEHAQDTAAWDDLPSWG